MGQQQAHTAQEQEQGQPPPGVENDLRRESSSSSFPQTSDPQQPRDPHPQDTQEVEEREKEKEDEEEGEGGEGGEGIEKEEATDDEEGGGEGEGPQEAAASHASVPNVSPQQDAVGRGGGDGQGDEEAPVAEAGHDALLQQHMEVEEQTEHSTVEVSGTTLPETVEGEAEGAEHEDIVSFTTEEVELEDEAAAAESTGEEEEGRDGHKAKSEAEVEDKPLDLTELSEEEKRKALAAMEETFYYSHALQVAGIDNEISSTVR